MSYSYQTEKPRLFSEQGIRMYIEMRDAGNAFLEASGAFMAANVMAKTSGDTWLMSACLDYRVELGELTEVSPPNCAGQHRIFIATFKG